MRERDGKGAGDDSAVFKETYCLGSAQRPCPQAVYPMKCLLNQIKQVSSIHVGPNVNWKNKTKKYFLVSLSPN
jgi:hypothetical protein